MSNGADMAGQSDEGAALPQLIKPLPDPHSGVASEKIHKPNYLKYNLQKQGRSQLL